MEQLVMFEGRRVDVLYEHAEWQEHFPNAKIIRVLQSMEMEMDGATPYIILSIFFIDKDDQADAGEK